MYRLTGKDEQGVWELKGVELEQFYDGAVITDGLWDALDKALWELMEYEDTGVDPDEVKKLAEEEAKNRWILPGERLPKDDTLVLVQIIGKADHVKFNNAIQMGSYYPADGWLIDGHFDFEGKVVAWQPLPEPYKEEAE